MIGNFIGDHLRSSQFSELSEGLRKGVVLHRFIDSAMDNHPEVRKSTKLLHPHYKKYSPVVLDILADYFLSINFTKYSGGVSLGSWCQSVYMVLLRRMDEMPAGIRRSLPHMIGARWLERYGTDAGLKRTFSGLQKRVTFEVDFSNILDVLEDNHEGLNAHFEVYFPQLMQQVNAFKEGL